MIVTYFSLANYHLTCLFKKKKKTRVDSIHWLSVGAIKDVPLNTLAFWIKVRGLSPDFHTDRYLRRIGSAIGRFVQKDTTKFAAGQIRIRVEMDLLQPIIFQRRFTVDDGIVVDLEFFFENLYGRCKDCGLVTHVGLPCSETPLQAELQTDTPLARQNLERDLNQVGVIQPAGPMLVFGAQNSPQVGLERFMPTVKPKVRKEILWRPSVGSGDGSSGVQTDSNEVELAGGSEPKSDGSGKETFGASSSTDHAPNPAMHSPGRGLRRKRVDEDGISPKKMRLSLAVGRTNLDALTMGLCNVKPAEKVYKKRGRSKGTKNNTKEFKVVQASPMKKSPSKKSKSPRKVEKLVNGFPEFTLGEVVNGSNGKEPISSVLFLIYEPGHTIGMFPFYKKKSVR
ncbi:hypothetical protein RchiOBHm_Chr2g0152291 [Rosa chinensis]|uniref:DUF4283 domain-containing protein n=1 Tax=Rosa chinensis TaxID=74649 RepID=A0A2P6S0F0_ROSCH|nr:hypothetical protein RchiOBHm_Chr2g0152291 [Rosa chinensis]